VSGRRTVGTILVFFGNNINSECCINTICKYLGHFSYERFAEIWQRVMQRSIPVVSRLDDFEMAVVVTFSGFVNTRYFSVGLHE
jgi:hypothetical protein